jgi:hypothetical protein
MDSEASEQRRKDALLVVQRGEGTLGRIWASPTGRAKPEGAAHPQRFYIVSR